METDEKDANVNDDKIRTKPQDVDANSREKNGANSNSNRPRGKYAQETRHTHKENEGPAASSIELWPQNVENRPRISRARKGATPTANVFPPKSENPSY